MRRAMAVDIACPTSSPEARRVRNPPVDPRRGPSNAEFLELGLVECEARDCLVELHGVLQRLLDRPGLSIYEAGGGSTSFLPRSLLAGADVTVVDIDPEQLANNVYAHHRIQGDIQRYALPRNSFDLVACYNVIEHLPDVEAALRRFFECVRAGGLVVIGAPNPASLSGMVTRFTPHWFHVWYYRHIVGKQSAGLPGEPPFPVYFHHLVWPARLKAFARRAGFEVVFERKYESPRYAEMRARRPMLGAVIDLAANALNVLALNRIDVRQGDYHLVLRKT